MANTLKIKRGLAASIPQGQLAEPLFTTDTYDLYIGKGSGGNQRIQNYIASGTSSQFLKGDGSLDSTTYQSTSEKGQNNGYASLDSGGKVPAAQLPNSIMDYKGTWDASTNTPTLADGTGNAGDVYICSVGGTQNLGSGSITFAAGDWVVYSGSVWQKSINSNAVASVNGQTGAVVLYTDDISEDGSPTNLWFTNARARAALSLTTIGSSGMATYDNMTGVLNVPNYSISGLGGVPTSRQLTINGTAFDLSADRSWSVGTVTSVAALTIGTTGTDITSTVANGTTTPVITLNIPTASATNRGALSSADWTTFNNKQNAFGNQNQGTVFAGPSTPTPATPTFRALVASDIPSLSYLPLSGGTLTGTLTINNSNNTSGIVISGSSLTVGNDQSLINLSQTWNTSGYPTAIKLNITNTSSGILSNLVDLQVGGTSEFKVDKDGNTTIAGTLNGTSSSMSSTSTATAFIPTGSAIPTNGMYLSAANTLNFATNSGSRLSISSTGAATFSSTVNAGGAIKTSGQNLVNEASVLKFSQESSTVSQIAAYGATTGTAGTLNIIMKSSDASVNNVALSFASTGAATFSGNAIIGTGADDGNRLQVNGSAFVKSGYSLYLGNNNNANYWGIQTPGTGTTALTFAYNSGSALLSIASTGAATFSSSVTINGQFRAYNNGYGLMHFDNTSANNTYVVSQYVSAESKFLITTGYNGTGANSALAFGTTDTERMRITSGGNVGIGTSPSKRFVVNQDTSTGYFLSGEASGTEIAYWYYNANEIQFSSKSSTRALTFLTQDTERMRITSGGNVGIGTTSPVNYGASYKTLTINATSYPVLDLSGADTRYFTIVGASNETVLGTYINGPLNFYTNATERMRITSGGEVYIAGTTDQGAYNLQCNGTGVWGAGAYVNGSDIALKENIKPILSGLDFVSKMKPVSYNYIQSYSKDRSLQTGFIAQDLIDVFAGQEWIEGIVKKGNEHYNVAYQNLIPILTKAIQELKTELDILKNTNNN